MTTQTPATPEELEQARDDREFPEDLDWNAEYTVLAEQNDGRLSHRKDDWLYALTHQYAGEEAIINGEAERYIHDTLSPGIHVAYSFDPVLRNGTLTVLITMHPAVLDHHKDPTAIGDETMATAQVQVLFQSERTAALVRAALEEQDEEEETPDAPPAGDGEQLPEELDWSARYTVLVEPGRPPGQRNRLEGGTDRRRRDSRRSPNRRAHRGRGTCGRNRRVPVRVQHGPPRRPGGIRQPPPGDGPGHGTGSGQHHR